jgi:membrane-associated protease RseP (regulator of RpoE activity)
MFDFSNITSLVTTIFYFLVVLSVLVLVHEIGHFFFARLFGVRVEEFGLGYPPRAAQAGCAFRAKRSSFRASLISRIR